MSDKRSLSRRRFVAGASAGLLLAGAAGAVPRTAAADSGKLAIEGGEKAVKMPAGGGRRWGEPERQQLDAMLQQRLALLLARTADQIADPAFPRDSAR